MTAFEEFLSRLRRRQAAGDPSVEPSHTAQAAYKQMINDMVSPAVRGLGLKGSGGRYEVPSETYWAMVSFQKSAYSDARSLRFTINLFVVERAVWEEESATRSYWPVKPTGSMTYTREIAPQRIGLVASGHDTWWSITAGEDTAPVAKVVIAMIDEVGLPWLRERMGGG